MNVTLLSAINMATFNEQSVNDGFMRGVEAGVSVQKGVRARLRIKMTIRAKTVSNVFKELQKYKQDFKGATWEKIEKAHARGDVKFFYTLLSISGEGSYDYENKNIEQEVHNETESQRVAQALQATEEIDVSIH